MIKLNNKRKILIMYQTGNYKTEIAREVKLSRKTVRKYINEYEEKIRQLKNSEKLSSDELETLVEELSSEPKYDSSSRKSIKLTDEVKEIIDNCIEENRIKIKNHNRKQVMKIVDIHELLERKNIDIQYTTVCNYIGDVRNIRPATLKLHGKGNKTRIIPLMPQTLNILNIYMNDCKIKGYILLTSSPVLELNNCTLQLPFN